VKLLPACLNILLVDGVHTGLSLELEIPEGWIGEEVRLIWDSTSEAMVWKNGEPLQVVFLQCV